MKYEAKQVSCTCMYMYVVYLSVLQTCMNMHVYECLCMYVHLCVHMVYCLCNPTKLKFMPIDEIECTFANLKFQFGCLWLSEYECSKYEFVWPKLLLHGKRMNLNAHNMNLGNLRNWPGKPIVHYITLHSTLIQVYSIKKILPSSHKLTQIWQSWSRISWSERRGRVQRLWVVQAKSSTFQWMEIQTQTGVLHRVLRLTMEFHINSSHKYWTKKKEVLWYRPVATFQRTCTLTGFRNSFQKIFISENYFTETLFNQELLCSY